MRPTRPQNVEPVATIRTNDRSTVASVSGEVIPPMCTLNQPAAPSSTAQALAMVSAGLGYLAGCDAADLGTAAQAEALVGLEQRGGAAHRGAGAESWPRSVPRAGSRPTDSTGPSPGCVPSPKSRQGQPPGRPGGPGGCRPTRSSPDALAAGQLSASWARQICEWTDQLPEDLRSDADRILLAAALGGADIHDLKVLAREMIERARSTHPTLMMAGSVTGRCGCKPRSAVPGGCRAT